MFKVIKTAEQIALEQTEKEMLQRVLELKKLLSESDFKVLADYDKDITAIKSQRQEWRNELRTLESK